jgi:acyl carrier protein
MSHSICPGTWTFAEFWTIAADAIGLEAGAVAADDQIFDDLGLDSLHVALLVAFLDDQGCEVPEDLLPSMLTADDVYAHYLTRTNAQLEGVER